MRLGIVIIFALCFIVFCSGCATVAYNDCGQAYIGTDKAVCERKAIRREDRRFERIEEARRHAFCPFPNIYDHRVERCRQPDAWL